MTTDCRNIRSTGVCAGKIHSIPLTIEKYDVGNSDQRKLTSICLTETSQCTKGKPQLTRFQKNSGVDVEDCTTLNLVVLGEPV